MIAKTCDISDYPNKDDQGFFFKFLGNFISGICSMCIRGFNYAHISRTITRNWCLVE